MQSQYSYNWPTSLELVQIMFITKHKNKTYKTTLIHIILQQKALYTSNERNYLASSYVQFQY